jgi:hypothetical protein
MASQYLSCAETAKLVRAALRESFPGVRFSVRSSVYSGGASITINYVNGPTYDAVKSVVAMFEGAYFDGMTDYQGYNYNSLDGVETSFGANYIFVNRELTLDVMQSAVQAACEYYGLQMPTIKDGCRGAYIADFIDYNDQRRIMDRVSALSFCETQPSPTLARVQFLGDDGYGFNSVGRLAA